MTGGDEKRVYLFDTTLRDGVQAQGVDFSLADRMAIAATLDSLGIDYVEGGWPGANPADDRFFTQPPPFGRAKLVAFGMTRRDGRSAANDPGLAAVLSTPARAVCLVGKAWDFHVDVALGLGRDDYIDIIADSVGFARTRVEEVMFDAEHFFDGYKANRNYAMSCLRAAWHAGARWLVLCDTNGGTLPHEIAPIVEAVCREIPGTSVGIHCHDDTGNAVANSLVAVHAGARQVQATINGLGERCGNADMVALIPSLMVKMGYATGLTVGQLAELAPLSRMLDARLNVPSRRGAAYVGASAFAHKGGLHVAAVEKDPRTYEHIDPAVVGNARSIVVSDRAGRATLVARLRAAGIAVDPQQAGVARLLTLIKQRDTDGYAYDEADASFDLLARRELKVMPDYFALHGFRVMAERRWNADGELATISEATVRLVVGGRRMMGVSEGTGPVHALDAALRKALLPYYPALADMVMVDFKVRILDGGGATGRARVLVESGSGDGRRWTTLGVSPNIIEAAFCALSDAIDYKLLHDGMKPPEALTVADD